jgi:hypothetical protein
MKYYQIVRLWGPIMDFNKLLWPSRGADKSALGAMNRPLRLIHVYFSSVTLQFGAHCLQESGSTGTI